MALIDGIWLFNMAKRFYAKHIGHLMAESPSWPPALIFYGIYTFGITFFVISPALKHNTSLQQVFIQGALLGLFGYGTYDFTCQAVLKNWNWTVSLVDVFWGSMMTGLVSALTVYVVNTYLS